MHTIDPYNRRFATFRNLSGALITGGSVVETDATPSGSLTTTESQTIDPFATSRGPLEGVNPVQAILYSIQTNAAAGTAGESTALGVAVGDIPDGEWGVVQTWGPAAVPVTDATDDAHLTAYGASTTAGALIEVTPPVSETAGDVYVLAFQVGASGATTAEDKRDVFILIGDTGGWIDDACPFGDLV